MVAPKYGTYKCKYGIYLLLYNKKVCTVGCLWKRAACKMFRKSAYKFNMS